MQEFDIIQDELTQLQKEQGGICVSVIVPTHRLSPDRRVDMQDVKRTIRKAKDQLSKEYGEQETSELQQAFADLFRQIDFLHNREGLGFFVSAHTQLLVSFFFPVMEKIMIADSFETRDLLYQLYYARPYFVLLYTNKEAHLFKGIYNELTEIKDEHFPLLYKDDYEYSRPSRGLTYEGYAVTKDFEREKSQLKQIRIEQFVRKVDNLLKPYLTGAIPLVVTGTKKELSLFKRYTTCPLIIGEIKGNYFYAPIEELGALTWQSVKSFLDEKKQEALIKLQESRGAGKSVWGLADVWQTAQEGKGAILLVEKDYSSPGFLKSGDPSHLHLTPPTGTNQTLPDAVYKLIQMVWEKRGEVILVENDRLGNYQHIAMITRY